MTGRIKDDTEFLKTKFGKHRQIEVLGYFGDKDKHGTKLYMVKCHTCATDPELHGDATYQYKRTDLIKGKIPCGCGQFRATKEQYIILINRQCDIQNYKFHGYVGDWLGNETKISLECSEGHKWSTNIISHFLYRGVGCTICNKKMLPEHEAINMFKATGSYHPETSFWRDVTKCASDWYYKCGTCSYDTYVQNELCSGIFKSSQEGLKKGYLACRCSPMYKWTKSQREFQINEGIMKRKLNYKFLGWVEEGYSSTDKFYLECPTHDKFKVSVAQFVYRWSKCPQCARFGFKTNMPAHIYVLLVSDGETSFTGYGISNCVRRRMVDHRTNIKKFKFKILDETILELPGIDAKDIERLIMANFTRYPQQIPGFIEEATYSTHYDDVVNFVKAQITLRNSH